MGIVIITGGGVQIDRWIGSIGLEIVVSVGALAALFLSMSIVGTVKAQLSMYQMTDDHDIDIVAFCLPYTKDSLYNDKTIDSIIPCASALQIVKNDCTNFNNTLANVCDNPDYKVWNATQALEINATKGYLATTVGITLLAIGVIAMAITNADVTNMGPQVTYTTKL